MWSDMKGFRDDGASEGILGIDGIRFVPWDWYGV